MSKPIPKKTTTRGMIHQALCFKAKPNNSFNSIPKCLKKIIGVFPLPPKMGGLLGHEGKMISDEKQAVCHGLSSRTEPGEDVKYILWS
jgi:hypothetical protein